MKKLLNKPWFVVLLALSAVALVGNSIWQGMHGSSPAGVGAVAEDMLPTESEATGEAAAAMPATDALKALVLPKAVARDPFALRERVQEADATVTAVLAPDSVETVHLSALWTQRGETFTLINDRICQAGDVIGRLKIESATQEGVWLTHWKGRDFIALGRDFTLRTPATQSSL